MTREQPAGFETYLAPTPYIERDHPAVRAFTREAVAGARSAREKAVRLYYAVRDGIRYDPYRCNLDPETYRASTTLRWGRNFCIPKAILLAAGARAVGIPSRLGFADVRNHLATPKLLEQMRTDVFVFHGFTELHLDGRWLKATPTFNRSLCEKFGVETLEFDGRSDAILHPFDRQGKRHMEYLRDRGSYADFPLEEMARALRRHYPHVYAPHTGAAEGEETGLGIAGGDFEAEAEAAAGGAETAVGGRSA